MPTASFTHAARAPVPADDLWRKLQRAEVWESIGPVDGVSDPVHRDGALVSFAWSARVGPTTHRGTATVIPEDDPYTMTLDLQATELTGRLTARLHPDSRRCRLHVTLEMTSRGPMSTLFFPAVSRAVGDALPDQVERFVATLRP